MNRQRLTSLAAVAVSAAESRQDRRSSQPSAAGEQPMGAPFAHPLRTAPMQRTDRRLTAATCLVALGLVVGPAAAAAPPPGPAAGTSSAGSFEAPRDNLSPAAERAMLDEIGRNVARLRRAGLPAPQRRAAAVTYDFPLRLAPGLPGEAGHYVSALADHDPAAG